MAEKKVTVRFSAEGGRVVKAEMQGLGVAGTKAFGDIALAQKSAADSARTFEQALEAEDRAFDDLKASLDPTYAATRRYEAAVEAATRAVKMGAATQEQANMVIAQARTRLDTFGGVVADGGRGMNAYRGQIQNTAFQIQDFAVQVAGGTRASTALAQQLPQLLGGFGVLGAVIGAGAAIGIPLLSFYFRENAEDAATLENKIESLATAMDNLHAAHEAASSGDLFTDYGPRVEQARALLEVQKEIASIEAQQVLATARDASVEAFGDFGGLTSAGFAEQSEMLADLQAQYDVLAEKKAAALQSDEGADFLGLEAEMQSIVNAQRLLAGTDAEIKRIAETFQIAREQAVELISAIITVNEAQGPVAAAAAAEDLAAELGIATDNFKDATDEGRTLGQTLLEVVLQGMQFAALDLASPIAAAASTAATLAQNMNISLAAASALMSMGGGPSAVIFDPRDPNYDPVAAEMARLAENPNRVSPFDPSRLPRPSSPGSGSSSGSSGGSSEQAAEPDYWDEMIASVKESEKQFDALQQSAERGADTIADLFTSILDGSMTAKEALAGLLQQLAKVAMQKAVLGIATGGGPVGDAFAMLGDVISLDGGGYTGNAPRSGGLDGKGGFMAMMHPRETVIDHTKGQGGNVVSINVNVSGVSGDQAIQAAVSRGVTQGLAQYDVALPARVRKINGDKRGI